MPSQLDIEEPGSNEALLGAALRDALDLGTLATVLSGTVLVVTPGGQMAKINSSDISVGNLAEGLVAVELVDELPTTGNFEGRLAFLLGEKQLYTFKNGAWSASIPAVNITGQLTNDQIAAIAAAKLTGQIVSTQIGDAAITTPKLAAGSVETAKLAAGAVIAEKIAAGTITGTNIAAGTITGTNIAAGTITGNNILANTITGGLIQAGAIGATQIAANVIGANNLTISERSLDVTGLEFSTSGNTLSWAAGTVEYINDAGALATANVGSGSVAWGTGKVYVFWAKGATTLNTSTSYATARTANNVILAVYEGGDNLNLNLGRTIISGAKIRTGSITALQLAADSVTADKIDVINLAAISATLGAVNISSAIIGSLVADTINIAGNAVTVSVGAETAGVVSIGTSFTQMQSVAATWGTASVMVDCQFKANVADELEIDIRSNGVSLLGSPKTFSPKADAFQPYIDMFPSGAVSGAATTFWLRRTSAGTTNISARKMRVFAAKR